MLTSILKTVQAKLVRINQDRDRLVNLPELSTLIFQNKLTDSTPNDIFLVVDSGESLGIAYLDPEGGEVTSVGQIPNLMDPSVVVSCASSIFCLGDRDCSGLVHEFDLVKRIARTPTRMVEPVSWTACASSSHELIVSGGENSSKQIVGTCSVYDLATNSWTSLRRLRQPRREHRMCWLPDGRVFAIGGYYDGNYSLSSVEMLRRSWNSPLREEESSEWEYVAPMDTRRSEFGCCIVEGRIIVAGGATDGFNPRSSVESFEPPTATNTGQWTYLTDLVYGMTWCFLVPSAGGLVLMDYHSGIQLGRRNTQVTSSEWDQWTWECSPRLTSFNHCFGLATLPSTA